MVLAYALIFLAILLALAACLIMCQNRHNPPLLLAFAIMMIASGLGLTALAKVKVEGMKVHEKTQAETAR